MEEDDLEEMLGFVGAEEMVLGDDDDEMIILDGDDEFDDEDDELGFRRRGFPIMRSRGRRMARRRGGRVYRMPSGQRYRRRPVREVQRVTTSRTPGSPPKGAKVYPLGFPTVTFTATSGTVLIAESRPQLAVRPNRLIITVARSGPGSTGLVTLNQLIVGQRNQLVSADPIAAEAFAPDSFQTVLSLDPAQPGIDITLQFAISTLPDAAVPAGPPIPGPDGGPPTPGTPAVAGGRVDVQATLLCLTVT